MQNVYPIMGEAGKVDQQAVMIDMISFCKSIQHFEPESL